MNPFSAFSRSAWLAHPQKSARQALTPQKRKECDEPRAKPPSTKVPKVKAVKKAPVPAPVADPVAVPDVTVPEVAAQVPHTVPCKAEASSHSKGLVIGQNKNMAQLMSWFKSPQHRRVVLWGSTGTGKTMAAYQLPGNIVEFNPLSSHIQADLTRSLTAAPIFGRPVVLLDDVDAMPSAVLADVIQAINQLAKVQTNPLVITCTSLHTLPPCLTKGSLVLHFARVQPAPMRELLLQISPHHPNLDHVISLANGDVRQALSLVRHSTASAKDLAGSPFQMVLAAMNRRKPLCAPIPLFIEVRQQHMTWPFKSPKLVRERVAMQPATKHVPMKEDPGYVNLYGEFEACIFAYYLVPRHAGREDTAFIECAPDLSDWRRLVDGSSLAQDVQTVAMKELPSLMLEIVMSKARLQPKEVKDTAHTAVWRPSKKWDPWEDLAQSIHRLRL